MNKLTIMTTIARTAPLALLTVLISGSAFAGPPVADTARPKGAKLSIDVENHCVPNGRYLDVTTTVTLSGSKKGDGGGEIKTPTADAMFKGELCKHNPAGKFKCVPDEFKAVNAADQVMNYSGGWIWTKSVDLCATKDDETISKGTAVNALVSVPVGYDDGSTTTWVSNCDDLDGPYDWVLVGEDYVLMDVVDQSDVHVGADIVCPAVE